MAKPTMKQLNEALAAGLAVPVTKTVPGVMLADGRTYWPGDDGQVYDDHAEVHGDGGVYTIGPRPKGWKRAWDKVRRGAGSILRLLDSPIVAALIPGATLARIRRIAAVATMPPQLQLAAVIEDVGSERLGQVWDAVELARADGKLDEAEVAAIIKLAKGGA